MGRNGQILRVSVIGTGYLGLTHAVCMADLGHEVLAIDVDAEKIAKAARGETPFFEPGLEPLLRKNLDAGRLRFTDSFAEIGEFGDVHFICVGTPQVEGRRRERGPELCLRCGGGAGAAPDPGHPGRGQVDGAGRNVTGDHRPPPRGGPRRRPG